MTDTANLGLPCIDAAQAQKHVTHNEALRVLDTLVQLAALDRDLTAPPGSPSEGQRWIVKTGATGAWAGFDNQVAAWQDGAWQFSAPKVGWIAFVVDEGVLVTWNGSAWVDASTMITTLQNLVLLGVGTTADGTNPFSAKLNNALWVAKSVGEGGTGDLRYNLSKSATANTLSMLFQDNFSGRAEIGLTGDDDFHFKISSDGSTWVEALTVSNSTGGVRFLAAETDVASAATCDIGSAASLTVQITGTTTITSFGTVHRSLRFIRFAGALTLTHNATSLVLPTAANITTAAGDCAIATSDASGNWRVRHYQRADGTPLAFAGQTSTIEFVIDGGGSAIATGLKGFLEIPFNCTISRATLVADQSGSIVVDIFKCGYSQFDAGATHPVSGDKITASAPPTISSATKAQDSTLTGWTASLSQGDILAFNVNSAATIQRVTCSLKVTRN